MIVTSSDSARRPARRGRVLAALMMTMALVAMDATIIATALPQVIQDLGGLALQGWVFSGYLLGMTVTLPIFGKFADSYGRKPIIILGTLVFLASSALCAAAWDMPSLICFRVLQGIGGAGLTSTISTIAADLYSLRERGRVQGYISSVWGVAAVTGPAVGGVFAEYATWRWIFLVNLPIGAITLALLLRNLHEQVEPQRHRIDYAGAAGVLLTAGTLIFGLLQGGVAWPWWSVPSVASFAATGVFAALTVLLERRAAEPIVPPSILGRRVLAGTCLGSVAMGMMIMGPAPFIPTYGQQILGLNAILAGLVLAAMSISWPVTAAQSARFYLRIGFRDTALVGVVICLLGSSMFWLQPGSGSIAWAVASMFTLGAGFGLLSTSLLVGAQSTVEWDERGTVTGTIMFSRFLGQSLGAAIFGAVANASLRGELAHAPDELADSLPETVDDIAPALSSSRTPDEVVTYIRSAVESSTQSVFVGLSVCALICGLILLAIAPRRFPIAAVNDPRDDQRRR